MENNTDKKRRGKPQRRGVYQRRRQDEMSLRLQRAKIAQTPEPEKTREEKEPSSDSDKLPDVQL